MVAKVVFPFKNTKGNTLKAGGETPKYLYCNLKIMGVGSTDHFLR